MRTAVEFVPTALPEFAVVRRHPQLVEYVDALQKANAEALSFYPRCVFEREGEAGRLVLGLLNNEPCGYLYIGAMGRNLRLHQVCIPYDARRQLYGATLVSVVEGEAVERGVSEITLRCGFDLDANDFWRTLGYQCVSIVPGGVRRQRKINVWKKYLSPDLFADIEIEPAKGKTSAAVWRANKQTGLVTQFVRGRAMREYRLLLEERSQAKEEPCDG